LQALRNSLDLNSSTHLGEFGRNLIAFYNGNGPSIVSYLERKLGTNLRKQSDAVEHFHKICELLENEGSDSLLNKIRLQNSEVEWKCMNCNKVTRDTRGSQTVAFSLLINEVADSLKKCLELALYYERQRSCSNCKNQCKHKAKKTFNVEHLVLVVAHPYKAKITPSLKFNLNGLSYDLISVVLHSGSMHGGHYIAVVKDDSGKWSICNDSSVRPISSKDISSYMNCSGNPTQMIYKVTVTKMHSYNELVREEEVSSTISLPPEVISQKPPTSVVPPLPVEEESPTTETTFPTLEPEHPNIKYQTEPVSPKELLPQPRATELVTETTLVLPIY